MTTPAQIILDAIQKKPQTKAEMISVIETEVVPILKEVIAGLILLAPAPVQPELTGAVVLVEQLIQIEAVSCSSCW